MDCKILKQNQTIQIYKLILICIDAIISIIVSFVPSENLLYLTLFVDDGYLILGIKLRNIINSTAFALKFHLILAQLHYINDDFSWLLISNQLFYQIKYIHIPPTVNKTIKQTQQILRIVFCFFFIMLFAIMFFNKDFREQVLIQPYYLWIHSIFWVAFFIPYHFYSSSIFFSKMYLVLKMTSWFSRQFNTEAQAILKENPSLPMVMHVLKQFSTFYQLIQHLNKHLKYCYFLMVLFFFSYGLHVFYIGFFLDVITLIKISAYFVCIYIILILSYFSLVAGTVDVHVKQLSDCIYRVMIIDHRFNLIKYYTQVLLIIHHLTWHSYFC